MSDLFFAISRFLLTCMSVVIALDAETTIGLLLKLVVVEAFSVGLGLAPSDIGIPSCRCVLVVEGDLARAHSAHIARDLLLESFLDSRHVWLD